MLVFAACLAATPAAAQDGRALYAQHCASCHDNAAVSRAPAREAVAGLPADRILQSLDTGVMRLQGEALTAAERRAVATFLSTATTGGGASITCPASPLTPAPATDWNGWGASLQNDRFQRQPGLTPEQVPRLTLKWAFGFEGETTAATQPTVVGNRVFVGSASGRVYALGLESGCQHWTFKADAGVRNGVSVGAAGPGLSAYFGDVRANVYSLDALTGQLRWRRQVDTHPAARITGSPVLHAGKLYVPVSSLEELMAAPAKYECCTFRGSVVALDAETGEVAWKAYTIPDPPKPTSKNKTGTQLHGPSGAAVWHAPTLDPTSGSVFVATGDGYTEPAAPTTDAVIAFDLKTGAMKWYRQLTEGDAWNMACGSPDRSNCPETEGPDFDFGQPPMLIALPSGRRALVVGQKSGVVHALDPDDRGRILWSQQLGKGGVLGGFEWGAANDGQMVYFPLSDVAFKAGGINARAGLDPTVGGGLFALSPRGGERMWASLPDLKALAATCTANCSPAQPSPPAVMPGVVFSGSLDGHLRAHSTRDGKVIWDVDTAREFPTVNGVKAAGGSIDVGGPAIAYGMVLTTSGYATWGGKRGNVLLAFGLP
jgi:polyvinyl alcohol dehydrogenase (cytochrome)